MSEYEQLTESEQVTRYRDVHKRLYYPEGAISEPEFILPAPVLELEPEPEPLWVVQLKKDAARAAVRGKRVFVGNCITAVCAYYKIPRLDLVSQRRHRSIVRPRQVAMYLARKLTPYSLPEIGKKFGDRDHTTVLWAIRQVTALMQTDAQLFHDVEAIEESILGGAA